MHHRNQAMGLQLMSACNNPGRKPALGSFTCASLMQVWSARCTSCQRITSWTVRDQRDHRDLQGLQQSWRPTQVWPPNLAMLASGGMHTSQSLLSWTTQGMLQQQAALHLECPVWRTQVTRWAACRSSGMNPSNGMHIGKFSMPN